MKQDAIISDCGKYRYLLTRIWGDNPPMVFIMLNPSTADADVDDPTIRRCMHFAKREGCDGVAVINLYAFRATRPENLARAADPVGPHNDGYIGATIRAAAAPIVCAWGAHPMAARRKKFIAETLVEAGMQGYSLGLTMSMAPKHPLYLPNTAPLLPYANGVKERQSDG